MTRSLLLSSALLSAAVLAAPGCAHQLPAPLSGELNVMQAASDMGYNTPKVINGETLFCQREELTGTLVARDACLSSDQVVAKAQEQGDFIKYLLRAPNTPTSTPPRPSR